MTPIKLTDEEREVLAEALETALSNLRYEIADTDDFDFRQKLKEKEAILARVLAALGQSG